MKETNLEPLPPKPRSLFPLWAGIVLVALYLMAADLDLSLRVLIEGGTDIIEYFSRYGSPDFSQFPRYVALMGQTLATAFWGTVLAFLLSVVLAPVAAKNLSPSWACYRVAREALSFMRSIPDLMLALLFVTALGLGPLPGALALGIHSAGALGKFLSESLERVNPGVYEALSACGASFPQTIMFAGWPSITREVAGYTLYVLDRNVRMASVLGLVGAGGIGLELHDTLRLFQYNQAAALIIVMLVTIVVIDYASSSLRARLQ